MPVVDALGVAVRVPDTLAHTFASLPATDRPAAARVESREPVTALAELTGHAVARTPLLCVHAAVVSAATGVVAVPGYSGLGKTTLTAALLRAGFRYVSDEALALDLRTGTAVAFPRPLGLAGDVWSLLGAPGPAPEPGVERLVPPTAFGRIDPDGGPVRHIVLARRRSGPVEITPAPRGDAVVDLLRRSFNHYRAPEASFRAAVRVVRGAQVWRAGYEQAPELAAVLADRFAATNSK